MLIMLLFITVIPVLAHDGIMHPGVFWSLKNWWYDLQENVFAPPGIEQEKLKAQHALEYQSDFEKGETNHIVQDAVAVKTASVQEFLSEVHKSDFGAMMKPDGTAMTPTEKFNFDIVGETISAIKQSTELNQIRVLYRDFDDVLARNDPKEIAEFNKMVNDLEVYRKNCIDQFDIRNFREDMDSFKRLQEICPALKTKSAVELQKILADA